MSNGYARGTRVTVANTGPGSVVSGTLKADGSLVYSVLIDGAQKTARYPAADVAPIAPPAGAKPAVGGPNDGAEPPAPPVLTAKRFAVAVCILWSLFLISVGGIGGAVLALLFAPVILALGSVMFRAAQILATLPSSTRRTTD